MTAHRMRRPIAALCTILFVASAAGQALAFDDAFEAQLPDENATSSPVLDALILRPLGLVSLVGGVALFVPAAVLTAITRPTDIGKPFSLLVAEPAKYVWVDPLGEH